MFWVFVVIAMVAVLIWMDEFWLPAQARGRKEARRLQKELHSRYLYDVGRYRKEDWNLSK